MSPAMPDGVIESGHYVHRQAEGKGLSCAQVCGSRAQAEWILCALAATRRSQMIGIVKTDKMLLDSRRLLRKRDQRKESILKIKLIVEPQIVLHCVICRTVRCSKLKRVCSPVPGNVIFKLIALLVGLIRNQ